MGIKLYNKLLSHLKNLKNTQLRRTRIAFIATDLLLRRGIFILQSFNMENVIVHTVGIYRVSREECKKLRESVPYVKIYRYNPKHLYPKLNGYRDNGQRKVWTSLGSTHCSCQLTA
jgi:hypothetical protein